MGTFRIKAGAVNIKFNSGAGTWQQGGTGDPSDAALVDGINNTPPGTTGIYGQLLEPASTAFIRFDPDLAEIILDEGTPSEQTLDFFSLPAGFKPTAAALRAWVTASSDGEEIYFQLSSFEEGPLILTEDDFSVLHEFAYDFTPPAPTMQEIANNPFGWRIVDTVGGSTVFIGLDTVTGGVPAGIYGTYIIESFTWWFDGTHYLNQEFSPGEGWVEATPIPDLLSISPDNGPTAGGQSVTLTGIGFGDGASVTFDGSAATEVVVVDYTTITCLTPAHAVGAVDVVVTNVDSEFDTLPNGYTYNVVAWWTLDGTYQFVSGPPAEGWSESLGPATEDGWFYSTSNFGGDIFVVSNGRPDDPRTWEDISDFATGSAGMLGGAPGAGTIAKNRLVYPGTDYIVGTTPPTIRLWDGRLDRKLIVLPARTDTRQCRAVMSMITANGTVYVSSLETDGAGDFGGRVFDLNISNPKLTPMGESFPVTEVPYSLMWHMGRLWCGTNLGDATAGNINFIRPDIDPLWTPEYDLATSAVGGATSMASYGGRLYIGTDNGAGLFAKVIVRSELGAYTTSLTATGGAPEQNNGFLSMMVFQGNLYTGYWNDDTPPVAKIYRYDGSSWTTVYTGAGTTLRPYIGMIVESDFLFVIGGGLDRTGVILRSPDGVTWTDLTPQLPEADKTLLPIFGTVVT